jgi:NhaA family Na+:H+ antiporter
MALFIAELAFDPELLGSVKLGILATSVVCAIGGLLALTWLTRPGKRRGPNPRRDHSREVGA